ncbi:MAG: Uma2 family endonuclease [Hyphomicrobiaceae bacterium]|nr:Uma2 family endonuclease [Hyphomicrobiaceae bacterium]
MTGFSEEPRATYSAHMDKAAFFAWLRAREGGRYELKNGEIIVHPGVSRNHHRVTGGFAHALRTRLQFEKWDIAIGEFAVEIRDDIRYPDVLVERRAEDGGAYSTADPVLLVEVVSPSSAGRDLSVKATEYLGLPSLEAYIVASQDEPIVWIWQRDAVTRAFAAEPVEIAGRDRTITLDALGIVLPLAEIYRGLGAA